MSSALLATSTVFRSEPTAHEAQTFVETALSDQRTSMLIGRCTVVYDGRTASAVGPGERLLVLKPDGTLLVHEATSHDPLNWQPPGCTHEAMLVDDQLSITSTRSSPAEEVDVTFERIQLVAAFDLALDSDLSLIGTEEDLRTRIFANPELIEPGFEPLIRERETEAGPVDIYGTDGDGVPTIVELKRRRVGPAAVGQLTRYVEAVGRDLPAGREVRGILIAPSVTDRAARLLAETGFDHVALSPPDEHTGSEAMRLTEFTTEDGPARTRRPIDSTREPTSPVERSDGSKQREEPDASPRL